MNINILDSDSELANFFRTPVSPNFPEDSDILTNYFHPPLVSVTIFCPKFQPEVMGRKVENYRFIGWSEEKEPAKENYRWPER